MGFPSVRLRYLATAHISPAKKSTFWVGCHPTCNNGIYDFFTGTCSVEREPVRCDLTWTSQRSCPSKRLAVLPCMSVRILAIGSVSSLPSEAEAEAIAERERE